MGFKLAEGKGLREGWNSKELWKSARGSKSEIRGGESLSDPPDSIGSRGTSETLYPKMLSLVSPPNPTDRLFDGDVLGR